MPLREFGVGLCGDDGVAFGIPNLGYPALCDDPHCRPKNGKHLCNIATRSSTGKYESREYGFLLRDISYGRLEPVTLWMGIAC